MIRRKASYDVVNLAYGIGMWPVHLGTPSMEGNGCLLSICTNIILLLSFLSEDIDI